jgi:hypothetical protein
MPSRSERHVAGAAAPRGVAAVGDLLRGQHPRNEAGKALAVLLPGLGVGPDDPQAVGEARAVVWQDADEAACDQVRAAHQGAAVDRRGSC